MYYIPKYFKPYELVPRIIYESLPERKIWQLFDQRVLHVADRIRERYGKMIANTWYWGGRHQYRGWRHPGCKIGARYSQHRYGRALDLVPQQITAEEIRQDIKEGEIFIHITCIEDEVFWLHFDVRNYAGLLIITP